MLKKFILVAILGSLFEFSCVNASVPVRLNDAPNSQMKSVVSPCGQANMTGDVDESLLSNINGLFSDEITPLPELKIINTEDKGGCKLVQTETGIGVRMDFKFEYKEGKWEVEEILWRRVLLPFQFETKDGEVRHAQIISTGNVGEYEWVALMADDVVITYYLEISGNMMFRSIDDINGRDIHAVLPRAIKPFVCGGLL